MIQNEVLLVALIITHPAGFALDLFGEHLYLRVLEDGRYAVGEKPDPHDPLRDTERLFEDPYKAAAHFVKRRNELKLGADYEAPLVNPRDPATYPTEWAAFAEAFLIFAKYGPGNSFGTRAESSALFAGPDASVVSEWDRTRLQALGWTPYGKRGFRRSL